MNVEDFTGFKKPQISAFILKLWLTLATFRLPSTSMLGGTQWLQPDVSEEGSPLLPFIFFFLMVRKQTLPRSQSCCIIWKTPTLDEEGTRSLKGYCGTSQWECSPFSLWLPWSRSRVERSLWFLLWMWWWEQYARTSFCVKKCLFVWNRPALKR